MNDIEISSGTDVSDAIASVLVASSRLPVGATCLTQALTAQTLIGQMGKRSELRIGVAKDSKGKLEGHAWLEYGGVAVIGDSGDLSHYSQMSPVRGSIK